MKKIFGIILAIGLIGFSSCTDTEEISWRAAHDFSIENIMGEQVDLIQDLDTHAVNSNGFTKSENAKVLRGTYVAGSAANYIKGEFAGFSLHIKYTFRENDYSDDFTDAMFKSLWYEGAIHELGMEGEGLYENPFIYIGLINEEGILQKYVTERNASDDNSQLEILSMELIGKSDKGRDVYEVEVEFESRLVNMEDETDVLYLKNGSATLKVSNFSQDPVG